MRILGFMLAALLVFMPLCHADQASAYRQAINLAAQGDDRTATATLDALVEASPERSIWRQRMSAAGQFIRMRMAHQLSFSAQSEPNHAQSESNHAISESNQYVSLASAYAAAHPLLPDARLWPAIALAVIFPGGGHAWQGRWRDAGMAAMMVWPMLILTLWAARRRMGPVTVFFALITIWLWSGTVFSSMSLAERGNAEAYMAWWQGIWQSSGLPGRPW